jgi:hypothetical protein
MNANAAAAPTNPRPVLMLDAAPVLSGSADLVADGELVEEAYKLLGTVRGLVGWMMLELAGAPVLATTGADVLVMMVVLLILLETALLTG